MKHSEGKGWQPPQMQSSASFSSNVPSLLRDLPVLLAGFGLFYGLLSLASYWASPVNTQSAIDLRPSALPLYACFSVARLTLAYFISLAVTLVYAYAAAHSARAEKVLVPLLDTLQSIPVLSFLPPVMLAMVGLFPAKQLGVELGAILLIATGQVWNMTFSVYSSMKNVPREMQEAARVYRFSWWQTLFRVELPFASIGLVWNSMMSVAGGWFFLMACEMFVLGDRDLRLPGLGSYLQTAASAGDTRAVVFGLCTMVAVIVLVDQLVWRPLIAWSRKFKFEQVEASQASRSPVLDLIVRSELLRSIGKALAPASEALARYFSRRQQRTYPAQANSTWARPLSAVLIVVLTSGLVFAIVKAALLVAGISGSEWRSIVLGAGVTFLRVELVLLLAALWTVPVGIYVGVRPRLATLAQPIAQIAASVPATALFPIVLLALIRVGGGLGIGSLILLLLGTQWYILFNVIAGATAIPSDLKEVCQVFHFSTRERWRRLFLPAVFPYLVTGLVTASGGAWNASIVAEYFRFHGQIFTTTGLGSVISRATDTGNFAVLLGATMVMALLVVTVNRLVWRRLYALASGRFSLNG